MEKTNKKLAITKIADMKYGIVYEDFSFVVNKTDWENASDPICCELLTDEDMKIIAEKLGRAIRGLKANSLTDSDISDCVWTLYETEIVYSKTFYYEDLNEEEHKLIRGKHTKEDTLRMYNKYKAK